MTRYLYIETHGCQMNVYDTNRMTELMGVDGYSLTEDPSRADVILINSCSVRDRPEQKVLSSLGRYRELKLQNPALVIGVTGCVAQERKDWLFSRAPYLDLVLGTDAVARLPEKIKELQSGSIKRITDTAVFKPKDDPFLLQAKPTRARVGEFVTIQRGCDHFCTFCIVPFTRGRERSRSPQDIVDEVKRLVGAGAREITLLGQNVNSYGKKFEDYPDFAKLLYRVAEIDGVERIRFTTSHPLDFTEDLARAYVDLDKLCNHLHLPVQSGSNKILEAMSRQHTREHYLERIAMLRQIAPQVILTTDLIVGFPGETEEDFEQTLSLMDEVGYEDAYSFVYSPRPYTKALHMNDDVPKEVKKARLGRLQEKQREHTQMLRAKMIGTVVELLVEGPSRRPPQMMGRMFSNHKVNFVGDVKPGDIVWAKITKVHTNSLEAELAAPQEPRRNPSTQAFAV